MNLPRQSHTAAKAFTLLEMTIVILVLLTLIGIGTFSSAKISDWKLGRQGGETLRDVYSAQRLFLADHPTTSVSTITAADLVPYLPSGATSIPTVKSLEGSYLSVTVSVSPPVINNGAGLAYDPSGSSTDSLWDTGK